MSRRSCISGSDRGVRRLLASCLLSLLLYSVLCGVVLDRPLSLGYLRHELDAKLARGATVTESKLVILAGSNGPYSHRCETIEPILHMSCVNGGVAVGVGLDYLFARWQPLLHPGDTVYLPMEEAQYVRSRSATMMGPDAAIMLRHDWATLLRLPPDRWAGALFATDLRGALVAPLEMALAAGGFHDPRAAVIGETNPWGDHAGHTAARGNPKELARDRPWHADAAVIARGHGTRLIRQFLNWSEAHGVRVIGGLPTEFADAPMPRATRAAIREVYLKAGARFIDLPGHSAYPRSAFFDTPDHLNQHWQIIHSIALAQALRAERQVACAAHGKNELKRKEREGVAKTQNLAVKSLLKPPPQPRVAGAPTTPPQTRATPRCPLGLPPASAPLGSSDCSPAG